jgi:hypothetical protein
MHISNLVLGFPVFDESYDGLRNDYDWKRLKKCYHELLSFCEDTRSDDKHCSKMNDEACEFYWDTKTDRSYFLTQNGRVGRGCYQDQLDDILVVLYSAQAPFILRYDEGSNVAILIGDAYVYGVQVHGSR